MSLQAGQSKKEQVLNGWQEIEKRGKEGKGRKKKNTLPGGSAIREGDLQEEGRDGFEDDGHEGHLLVDDLDFD